MAIFFNSSSPNVDPDINSHNKSQYIYSEGNLFIDKQKASSEHQWTEIGTQPIKILAALATYRVSSISGWSIRVAMKWRSYWSLRWGSQGSLVSSLLRLQLGSILLARFKSLFLVIGNTSASLAVGRGARVTLTMTDWPPLVQKRDVADAGPQLTFYMFRFWARCLVKILKLKFGRDSEAVFFVKSGNLWARCAFCDVLVTCCMIM